jgi:hypothetical protein
MAAWVSMTDKFLSGWGGASRGRSLLSIECDNETQAEAIVKAAQDRGEMRRVRISDKAAKPRPGDVLTLRHVRQMQGHWLTFMPAAEKAKLRGEA